MTPRIGVAVKVTTTRGFTVTDSSLQLKQHAIATLASALITARGSGSLEDARAALEDAEHLLNPQPFNKDYREWQARRGEQAKTDDEVAEHKRQYAENIQRMRQSLMGR